MPDSARPRRRLRIALAWSLSALLVVVYLLLPEAGNDSAHDPNANSAQDAEPGKLDIVDISPSSAGPGSALAITYVGPAGDGPVRAFAGKQELEVLASRPGSLVARLPPGREPKRVKIRIARGEERSKPYDVQIEAPGWQKPFRSLVGGIALLLFGISAFSRGAREALGLDSAALLARFSRHRAATLGVGAAVGAVLQSTTAAAGLLVGLVSSQLLAVGPAAAAFLGSSLGATLMPFVTGIIAPREGLLVVAVGVLLGALAPDRRFAAVGKVVLGAGFVAFGLYLLRQGFEPFVSSPALLPLVDRLRGDSFGGVALCALVGALLVLVLQSPAPVVLLVLGFAQTTGHWDLKTSVAVLSGAGLGSGVGSLLTMPASAQGRRFVQLNLLLGLASTLIAASSVALWARLADRLVAGAPEQVSWGKRVLFPNMGLHLGVALALSELAVVLLLLPVIAPTVRFLERSFPDHSPRALPTVGDVIGVVRSSLSAALLRLQAGLEGIAVLALEGRRDAGRGAEHDLADARSALEDLFTGPMSALPTSGEGAELSRAMFATRQLQRSLESVWQKAEQLLDARIALSSLGEARSLHPEDEQVLREMQGLVAEGVAAVLTSLETREALDADAARAREIRMNGLEARARTALLGAARERIPGAARLAVLELADAYEAAGNQVYRLSEALSGSLGVQSRPSRPSREAAGA
jgi:hypothetical protein